MIWRPTIIAVAGLAMLAALTGCTGSTSSASPVGDWGSAAPGEPTLTLAEDGTLQGSDGCNRLAGEWSEFEGEIIFGDVATTLMACEGVDTWLSELNTATIEGATMHVYDSDGVEIGTLDRAGP